MNEERRQELRKWSAEKLMGYHLHKLTVESYFNPKTHETISKSKWTPDLPTAPASQIFGVIERMRKLGWFLFWNNEENLAEFYEKDSGRFLSSSQADTLPEAILEAAWATGMGR